MRQGHLYWYFKGGGEMVFINKYINYASEVRYLRIPISTKSRFAEIQYESMPMVNVDGNLVFNCFSLKSHPNDESIVVLDNYFEFIKTYKAEVCEKVGVDGV